MPFCTIMPKVDLRLRPPIVRKRDNEMWPKCKCLHVLVYPVFPPPFHEKSLTHYNSSKSKTIHIVPRPKTRLHFIFQKSRKQNAFFHPLRIIVVQKNRGFTAFRLICVWKNGSNWPRLSPQSKEHKLDNEDEVNLPSLWQN